MNILILSALYPPDIDASAQYAKELARRLAKNHAVSALVYGSLPEEIPGVSFVSVKKSYSLPIRLMLYFRALMKAIKGADAIILLNGASVELPAGIALRIVWRRMIYVEADAGAHERAMKHSMLSLLETFAKKNAKTSIQDIPPPRPEILPLEPRPEDALRTYESLWKAHVTTIEQLLQ